MCGFVGDVWGVPALLRWGAAPAMQAGLARRRLRFRAVFAASRAGLLFVLAVPSRAAYDRGGFEERCAA